MRILQVCYVVPPSFSGYGRQLMTVNETLLRENPDVEIDLLTAYDGWKHRSRCGSALRIRGLYSRGRAGYRYSPFRFYGFCLWLLWSAPGYLRKADVVHCVKAGPEAAFMVLLAWLYRKPILIKVAQDEVDPTPPGRHDRLRKLRYWLVGRATGLVALSGAIEANLQRAGVRDSAIFRIPNAVDTQRFAPSDADPGSLGFWTGPPRPQPLVLLFLGSISRRKGVDTLVEALADWSGDRPVCLLLAGPNYGDVPTVGREPGRVAFEHAQVEIHYLGPIEAPERLLPLVDGLVLPSRSEGLPNVVLESLSCGTPVVVSDLPVHRELVPPSVGMHHRVGDPTDLRQSLERFAGAPFWDSQPRVAARSLAVEGYSVSRIATRYRDLYRRLAGKE